MSLILLSTTKVSQITSMLLNTSNVTNIEEIRYVDVAHCEKGEEMTRQVGIKPSLLLEKMYSGAKDEGW
jgi:hypothetical protein